MSNEPEVSLGTQRAVRALGGGAAGAVVLTGLHEIARRVVPHAPRMDVIGERALTRALAAVGRRPSRGRRLFRQTLAGELFSNTLYYSLIGVSSRSRVVRNGVLLGLAAGLGAVLLPPRLGLGRSPGTKAPLTPLLTLAWYTAGGLAAAATIRRLQELSGR
jgi:hypothetical protein